VNRSGEKGKRGCVARPRAACRRLALVAALIALSLSVAPSASSGATPTDRKATGAFLRATYAFDRAALTNAKASNAASVAYIAKVSGECPGVLANAPSIERLARATDATPEQLSQLKQLTALQSEVFIGLLSSWLAPDHKAFEALANVVRPLRWSSARMRRLAHAEVTDYEQALDSQPPDACADMRAWVISGYRTLPPSASAALRHLISENEGSGPTLQTLIAQQEGPALKRLARQRNRVDAAVQKQLAQTLTSATGLFATLGVEQSPPVGAETAPSGERLSAAAIG
jgi:hypothetical protein